MTAYPTVELGGVVFAWMGGGRTGAAAGFEWTGAASRTASLVTRVWQQFRTGYRRLKAALTPADASALHTLVDELSQRAGLGGLWRVPLPQKDEVELNQLGSHLRAPARCRTGRKWVRVYHYIMPYYTFFPFEFGAERLTVFQPLINGHIFVPMDDENTMVFNWIGKHGDAIISPHEREMMEIAAWSYTGRVQPEPRISKEAQCGRRLAYRPKRPKTRDLLGHRWPQHARPCRAGKHGADCRPSRYTSAPPMPP